MLVNKNYQGTRLDKFLAEKFFSYSREFLKKAIAVGKVKINDKEVKAGYKLRAGDVVKVGNFSHLQHLSVRPPRLEGHVPSSDDGKRSVKIIYQDKDIIVIDKPAGLKVHPDGIKKERTLIDYLLEKFPEIAKVGDDKLTRPGIVHRLDKETSGVMVIAKNQKAFEYLKNLFKNRKVRKKYLALVYGASKKKEGFIEGEMGRSKRDFRKQALTREKVRAGKGRYSLTYYKVLREFDNEFSLLEVIPKTGRMHQIRVHLHSIGHPIVGDEKYFFKKNKPLVKPSRMFLHASEIYFSLPSGEPKTFRSSLPRNFEEFVGR